MSTLGPNGFRYRLPKRQKTVVPGQAVLFIESRGYVNGAFTPTAVELSEFSRTSRLDGVEIRMSPAVDLTGRVFGPDGQPLQNAHVRLTGTPGVRYPDDGRRVTTSADGSIRFRRVDAFADLHLVAWGTDGSDLELRTSSLAFRDLVTPRAGGEFWRDLHLRPMPKVALDLDISGIDRGVKVLMGGREIRPEHSLVSTTVRAGPQRVVLKDLMCNMLDEAQVEIPEDRFRYHLYLDANAEKSKQAAPRLPLQVEGLDLVTPVVWRGQNDDEQVVGHAVIDDP